MKLKQWLYGATALAMLAACSDKDIAPDSGGVENNGKGDPVSGYLAVEIKLPQETTTRGVNDEFNDGTSNEYQVDNAMIVLFKGTSEKTATFYKAQDLKKPFFTNMPEHDQITSSYLAAIQVTKASGDNDNFYGLVILNRNGTTTSVTEPDENGKETVQIGGVSFTAGSQFSAILNAITENSFLEVTGDTPDTKEYSKFFMTNAPLSTVPGGGAINSGIGKDKIQYLVNLGKDTYPTIDEAKNNIKSCIYVERAVAKVTCTRATNAFQLTFIDGTGAEINDLTVDATVRYALTNTNKKSYVVRNVEFTDAHFSWDFHNLNYYRMIGEKSMPKLKTPYHDVDQSYYRTYWCIDPNYEKAMLADKNVVTKPEEFSSINMPLYCKENTFTVANQNYGNSTLAVFQVDFAIKGKDGKIYGDGNLYTKDGETSKIYTSKEAALASEITRIKNDKDIRDAMTEAAKTSNYTGKIEDATQHLIINTEVKDNVLLIKSIDLAEVPDIFTNAGVLKFREIIGESTDKTSIQYSLLTAINNMSDITQYTGGVSYYQIPIQHFGDDYCPWSGKGITTEDAYNNGDQFDIAGNDSNDHALLYLGRYGMVRNNWYELNISSITALDSPKVPDIDLDLSDDNKEEKRYIGVEIHVLSWAKRTQDVHF